MDVAVVYESMFGNTRMIAEAVAEGLRSDPDVQVAVVPVAGTTSEVLRPVDLLVVGAPTYFLHLSSPRSRQMGLRIGATPSKDGSARPNLEPGSSGPGVREWLDSLPRAAPGRRAAAFDTRLGRPLAGGAARSIARRLRRRGYRMAAKPQRFIVADMSGPLREGEHERARAWGAGLLRPSG